MEGIDLDWLVTNWPIAAGVGAGVVVLIILLVVALSGGGKKKRDRDGSSGRNAQSGLDPIATQEVAGTPAALSKRGPAAPTQPGTTPVRAVTPAPGPVPAQATPNNVTRQEVLADLANASSWIASDGGPAHVAAAPSGLRIGRSLSAVSVKSVPAISGRTYICDYSVRICTPATNNGPVNFFVGAVARDASGAIVQYWIEQPPLNASEGTRIGRTSMVCGPDAATIHVGIHGPWQADNTHGDGEVEFTALRVATD